MKGEERCEGKGKYEGEGGDVWVKRCKGKGKGRSKGEGEGEGEDVRGRGRYVRRSMRVKGEV